VAVVNPLTCNNKADSLRNNLEQIVSDFDLLDDWDQRYQYLIQLGEKLPYMPEALKTDANKVNGCMSQVWIAAYSDKDDPKLVRFFGDSDTAIIKGVLAVLMQLIDGRSLDAIEQLDVDKVFVRLKLDEHLSPQRHVGVYAIVELMKRQAMSLKSTTVN
jgi:cysteine desulfuration protein SufE